MNKTLIYNAVVKFTQNYSCYSVIPSWRIFPSIFINVVFIQKLYFLEINGLHSIGFETLLSIIAFFAVVH